MLRVWERGLVCLFGFFFFFFLMGVQIASNLQKQIYRVILNLEDLKFVIYPFARYHFFKSIRVF